LDVRCGRGCEDVEVKKEWRDCCVCWDVLLAWEECEDTDRDEGGRGCEDAGVGMVDKGGNEWGWCCSCCFWAENSFWSVCSENEFVLEMDTALGL
jgi:hypothetical protein